jgi:hypothetical protein
MGVSQISPIHQTTIMSKDLKELTREEVQKVSIHCTGADKRLTHLAAQQRWRPGKQPPPPPPPPPPQLTQPPRSSQWVIVDAKVYDLSRFANLHPGGRAVLVDDAVAGQDATEAFYGLHRHEVLERPQYARLQIGVLRGEQSVITGRLVGGLSSVPYAEPTYLCEGFHSPYYTEVRKLRVRAR